MPNTDLTRRQFLQGLGAAVGAPKGKGLSSLLDMAKTVTSIEDKTELLKHVFRGLSALHNKKNNIFKTISYEGADRNISDIINDELRILKREEDWARDPLGQEGEDRDNPLGINVSRVLDIMNSSLKQGYNVPSESGIRITADDIRKTLEINQEEANLFKFIKDKNLPFKAFLENGFRKVFGSGYPELNKAQKEVSGLEFTLMHDPIEYWGSDDGWIKDENEVDVLIRHEEERNNKKLGVFGKERMYNVIQNHILDDFSASKQTFLDQYNMTPETHPNKFDEDGALITSFPETYDMGAPGYMYKMVTKENDLYKRLENRYGADTLNMDFNVDPNLPFNEKMLLIKNKYRNDPDVIKYIDYYWQPIEDLDPFDAEYLQKNQDRSDNQAISLSDVNDFIKFGYDLLQHDIDIKNILKKRFKEPPDTTRPQLSDPKTIEGKVQEKIEVPIEEEEYVSPTIPNIAKTALKRSPYVAGIATALTPKPVAKADIVDPATFTEEDKRQLLLTDSKKMGGRIMKNYYKNYNTQRTI